MSQAEYRRLLAKELSGDTFIDVQSFPLENILAYLLKILQYCKINETFKKFLLQGTEDRKEPSPFYCLPKIHKAKLGSRPITANH